MPEVLIDITRLLTRSLQGRLPPGVDRVSLAYIKYFSDRAQALLRIDQQSVVLNQSASKRIFEQLLFPATHLHTKIIKLLVTACFNIQYRPDLKNKFFLNIGHSGLEKKAYLQQLKQNGVKPLFLIHDLIPITHPEYCREGEMDKHIRRINNVLNFASGIITNSQNTLNHLQDYAGETGQIVPTTVVAHLGLSDFIQPSAIRPIAQPYFVVLGTIESRKNHYLLLHIWRKLIAELGTQAPRLLIIGQRGWECENVIDLLERCPSLQAHVTELASCSDLELVTYLKHAQALLFPSFMEGYGIPLIEALALGTPVIASHLAVFHEIAGSIPDYIDPLDSIGWIKLIKAYCDDNNEFRQAQLNLMENFVQPTWAAHFQQVEELMERVR